MTTGYGQITVCDHWLGPHCYHIAAVVNSMLLVGVVVAVILIGDAVADAVVLVVMLPFLMTMLLLRCSRWCCCW